ncbi:MAG: hydrolase [Rhodospirillales bacterium]|nr:hydrolase [Rhodospirillales bacterium]
MMMSAADSCLLVVDVQARLAPKVNAVEHVLANVAVLIRAARRLGVPIIVSEQYPRGLGTTVPEVAEWLPAGATVEKMTFSCLGDERFAERFLDVRRRQAVVVGLEAHVCVLQTVMDLLAAGTETFVVEDAVSSRTPRNHATAISRVRSAGARIVSTEMVVFEWLTQAGTPEFKELSALIK